VDCGRFDVLECGRVALVSTDKGSDFTFFISVNRLPLQLIARRVQNRISDKVKYNVKQTPRRSAHWRMMSHARSFSPLLQCHTSTKP
jgi:hypothetical protein